MAIIKTQATNPSKNLSPWFVSPRTNIQYNPKWFVKTQTMAFKTQTMAFKTQTMAFKIQTMAFKIRTMALLTSNHGHH
jgi:hypothetical protein